MSRYSTQIGYVLVEDNSLNSFSLSDTLSSGVSDGTIFVSAPAIGKQGVGLARPLRRPIEKSIRIQCSDEPNS